MISLKFSPVLVCVMILSFGFLFVELGSDIALHKNSLFVPNDHVDN